MCEGVHVRETARVHLVEVAVRDLARIDAIGGLKELAFVVGDPAAVDGREGVERGHEPDDPEGGITR